MSCVQLSLACSLQVCSLVYLLPGDEITEIIMIANYYKNIEVFVSHEYIMQLCCVRLMLSRQHASQFVTDLS
jgi:hypothetical protein